MGVAGPVRMAFMIPRWAVCMKLIDSYVNLIAKDVSEVAMKYQKPFCLFKSLSNQINLQHFLSASQPQGI